MRRRTPRLAVVAAAVLLLGAAGCADDNGDGATNGNGNGNGEAATTEVTVDDNFFDPETLEVSVGDTVTWTWVGSEPHNVISDEFESETQTEGTFEYTFDEAGTYEYSCTIHPGMDGTIEVSA